MDLVPTEHDPFPGLHDGSKMHRELDNSALVPHSAADFMAGNQQQ
jgi:hypothetical protein